MNKEGKDFKASHFDNMKELLDTIKVWLKNEEDYGTLYDDFNRYFDTGAMEEMYYYINQLETNRDEVIEYLKYALDEEKETPSKHNDWRLDLLEILERGKE